MSARPPRLATWLLSRLVRGPDADGLLGDLEERWHVRRTGRGWLPTTAWYWGRALTIPVWLGAATLVATVQWATRELRTSLRAQARAPMAAVAMVCTLALGIGAATAVLSVVDAVLLEPLPYPEADRLVTIGHRVQGLGVDEVPMSSAAQVVYEDARTFESMALYQVFEATLRVPASAPERATVVSATRSLFAVLGVTPLLGRPFTAEEDAPGGARAALLTERYWRSRYAADAGVLGRAVRVDGADHEIVGVLPESFAFPTPDVAVVVPMRVDRSDLGGFNVAGIGRLRGGVELGKAERELAQLLPRITSVVDFLTPAMLSDMKIAPVLHRYRDVIVGDVRAPLWIVLAAMSFVLLIACVNVSHLLLVRAEGRRQELAVRSAMGAGRAQLLGLFVAESGVLALGGAVIGLGLAHALLRLLILLAPPGLPRVESVALDGSVLATVALLTGTAALVFGVVSHRVVAHGDPAGALRGATRGATSDRGAGRLRRVLMASQVAFAALLLVGSGLTVRSMDRLQRQDAGFRSAGVLTFGLALSNAEYPEPEAVAALHRDLLGRIEALPGVEAAGATGRLPLTGFSTLMDPLSVRGRSAGDGAVPQLVEMRFATPGYFEALGIPLLRGRWLDWSDAERRSGAVLITERVAREFFGGQDPIGQSVAHGLRGLPGERAWSDVVGIVGDVRGVSPFEEPLGAVYYPALVRPGVDMDWMARSAAYAVRTAGDPMALVPAVRRVLAEIDPLLPMTDVRPLDDVVAASRARVAFATSLLAVAAMLGLVLGAVGLYGVTSVSATRRTREIGVRIALGATPASVTQLIVRQGVVAAAIGLAAGLFAAALLARFLGSILFEVHARDPLTYGAVAIVLLAVAAAASWLPAARAGRSDPRRALEG